MSSPISSGAADLPWTVHVHGPAASEAQSLIVHGQNLMSLVARLVADARVQDIVVRPRIREVRADVSAPASARGGR